MLGQSWSRGKLSAHLLKKIRVQAVCCRRHPTVQQHAQQQAAGFIHRGGGWWQIACGLISKLLAGQKRDPYGRQ